MKKILREPSKEKKDILMLLIFLKTYKKMPELKYNGSLSKAAIEHGQDLLQYSLTSHEGSRG